MNYFDSQRNTPTSLNDNRIIINDNNNDSTNCFHNNISSVKSYLNICTWNIGGLLKYQDDIDFHNYISTFDIVGLNETWSVKDNMFDIHGYTHFCYFRPKRQSAYRGSGGVSVYIKDILINDGLI